MGRADARKYSPRRPREERREQLLDATLGIVDSEGFDAFSIEAVARKADLSKTVVYATFGTREDLLRALVDRELERAAAELAEAIPGKESDDPGQLLTEALTNVLEAARARPETWRLFLLPADGMPLAARANVQRHRQEFLRSVEPLVGWGLAQLGEEEFEVEVATQILVASAEQGIRMTLSEPDRFPPERLARFATAFLRPYFSRPGNG